MRLSNRSKILVVAAVIVAFVVGFFYSGSDPVEMVRSKELKTQVVAGNSIIDVTLADTPALRAQGLGGVKSLADNEGMLFIFESKDTQPPFWMKGMIMAIDIIWINDGLVVQVNSDLQPPDFGTSDDDLDFYIPREPIDYVLEVRAGLSEKLNLIEGTLIEITQVMQE